MKENKENTKFGKGGWYEDKEEIVTEKGVERKAPRHREVAVKDKYSSTLRTPLFAPLKQEDKDQDEDLTEDIIEEVQDRRKPSAIAKDNSKTTEKIGDKEDPEDLVVWIKNPGESDLEGVDDKQPKIKPVRNGLFKGAFKVEVPEKR